MKLKLVIDKLEDVAEGLRSLYTKGEDGKFYLEVEDTESAGLKSALQTERKRANEATAKLRELEEQVTTLTTDLEDAKKAGAGKGGKPDPAAVQAEVERITGQLQTKHANELKTRDDKIATLTGTINRTLVDTAATQSIAAAKGEAKLLLPHIRDRIKVVEEDGQFALRVVNEKGEFELSKKPGSGTAPMTVDELVETMKGDPVYGRAFEGTGASGGGAKPTGGTGGTFKTRADFKTPADKAKYVAEHGMEAYLNLPEKPDAA